MRKLLAAVAVVLSLPSFALAASWQNVSLVDQMCLSKVKSNPDKHPTSCLLNCANSGYGIITQDGKYVKLDKAGNEKAVAALKATSKKDHIRVNVDGERKGDVIQVASLKIAD
jgi:hypothetical protein